MPNGKGDVGIDTYDAASRRTKEQHQTSTGTVARTINYSYAARGLLVSFADTSDAYFVAALT